MNTKGNAILAVLLAGLSLAVLVLVAGLCLTVLTMGLSSCDEPHLSTDQKQAIVQAQALEQAHAQIGMPAIGDFSEKRELKDLYELRDKPLPTHSYLMGEHGCLVYLGPSVGYGLPYATQYTAPTRFEGAYQVPQAEPNGLFMPGSAEGTWIMLKVPGEEKIQPVYVEPRVVVSPFRLLAQECPPPTPAASASPQAAPKEKTK